MRWLRSGEILLATEAALFRFDPATDAPAVALKMPCFGISTDEAGLLLALSPKIEFSPPEPGQVLESAVQLFSLPALEPVRSFLIPGHQASSGGLSPDGRLLAVKARPAKGQPFTAVFDVATGRELARWKASSTWELQFLPDNRTLAIPTSSYAPAEPVALWTIPL